MAPWWQWDDSVWEKACWICGFRSAQLHSHGSKCRTEENFEKQERISYPAKEPSDNSSWPARTTTGQSQWWCSSLTEWAQAFVCLKPLTYFYSHSRSQCLYGVITELMQQDYSRTAWKKKARDACQTRPVFIIENALYCKYCSLSECIKHHLLQKSPRVFFPSSLGE